MGLFASRTGRCVCALAASVSAAQEFRGAITGRINDTSGVNVDFGKVTVQNNLPRDIQLALKLLV
jgi:hypothetical protein